LIKKIVIIFPLANILDGMQNSDKPVGMSIDF